MFPFRDHNPSSRIPYVTYALIAINVLIFIFNLNPETQAEFYYTYGLVPSWVSQGQGLSGYLTSMFLHGGWMHLIGNMLFLWIFGDNIEDTLGHIPYLIFYVLTGIAAAGLHVFLNPTSEVPLIGASGAIAGVMGGYWLLFPKARVDILIFFVIIIRTFTIPAFIVLSLWLAMQVFSGFSTSSGGGGVAYWAHFGGFVAGALVMIPVWLRRGATHFWTRTEYHPPYPETRPIRYGQVPRIARKR